MKKSLYMTTALAAAGVLAFGATDAMAAEKAKKMQIKVSGSMKSLIGFASNSGSYETTASNTSRTHYDAFNIVNDSEVHFKGTTKLDNGISVSVVIQLETDQKNNGTQVDETYVKLTGGFGDIRIGSQKAATFTLKHAAPLGGAIALGNPDTNNWIIKPSAVANAIKQNSTHIGGGDNMKLLYITPKFSGFRVGASYEPSSANADTMPAVGGTAGTEAQSFDAIVSYENKLGSVNVKADVAYFEKHGNAATSTTNWRGGVLLGFGAITVGGSYKETKDADTSQSANAAEVFDAGVSYKSGPFGVGVQYFNATTPQTAAVSGDDEVTKIALGGSYTMGPGVSLVGTVVHVDWDDETTADSSNNSGWAAIGGIKVSF
ncbi:MAG: porin [Rhodospirillaceae bacterium]|nr:porin [Rhodospirillaceae bacterium]